MPHTRPIPAGPEPVLLRLERYEDERGVLAAAVGDSTLPFAAVRYFVVHGVPAGVAGGRHAHRRQSQLLACVAGSCTVETKWGDGQRAVHQLSGPTEALFVPPGVWLEYRDFSADGVVVVLCSHAYDADDLIDADVAPGERVTG